MHDAPSRAVVTSGAKPQSSPGASSTASPRRRQPSRRHRDISSVLKPELARVGRRCTYIEMAFASRSYQVESVAFITANPRRPVRASQGRSFRSLAGT